MFSDDVAADPRFHHPIFRQIAHQSGLVLPLLLGEEVAGAFYVAWWNLRRSFTDRELDVLKHVCEQVAQPLGNARLFEQAKTYDETFRELVGGELRIAREIQSSALPHDFGLLAAGTGLKVHALMEPTREGGGDLYDVLRLPGNRLVVVLGDVSGKGIPAAMFMMAATALLRVAVREGLEPPELLARLNDQLCADNPTSMFEAVLEVRDPGAPFNPLRRPDDCQTRHRCGVAGRAALQLTTPCVHPTLLIRVQFERRELVFVLAASADVCCGLGSRVVR